MIVGRCGSLDLTWEADDVVGRLTLLSPGYLTIPRAEVDRSPGRCVRVVASPELGPRRSTDAPGFKVEGEFAVDPGRSCRTTVGREAGCARVGDVGRGAIDLRADGLRVVEVLSPDLGRAVGRTELWRA